jgi:putative acetyltransferase
VQIDIRAKSAKNEERWIGLIEEQYFLKAAFDDEIVGFGSLDFKKGTYLDFLYVHKDYLRRRIANTLLDALNIENSKRGGRSHEI